MRTFRRVMLFALAAGVVSFLVVPLVIPQQTSGTLTYREAASASGEFVELAGVEVHLETREYAGDCACTFPLIVLMHGFGASTFSWRDVMDPLSASGAVIAYDRPGFGFSERPTTWTGENPYGFAGNFAILDDLIARYGENRRVVLVGHSAGGQLAAEYVRLNPKKVQRLVLADPAILTTGGIPEWVAPILSIPQIDALGPALVAGIASSGNDLLRESYFDQSDLTQAVYDGYQAPLQVAGWERGFWEFTKAPRSNGLADNLSTLNVPTLLITGSNDTVVPTADTEALATFLPNATLVVIANTAHLPQEEDPQAFAVAVNDWLAALN